MTYYGGKELAAAFRTVRNNTIKIAEDIPESQYDFKPAPDTKSIGQTLAHIAVGTGFQSHMQQNKVTDLKTVNFMELMQKFTAEENKPRTKAELVAFLKSEGDKFASFLESLPESFLAEQVTMPPGAQPGDEEPLRDAALAEGTRDAPPRPADDDAADERHRAAHHPRLPAAYGPAGPGRGAGEEMNFTAETLRFLRAAPSATTGASGSTPTATTTRHTSASR